MVQWPLGGGRPHQPTIVSPQCIKTTAAIIQHFVILQHIAQA
jgi:hypothetical protein